MGLRPHTTRDDMLCWGGDGVAVLGWGWGGCAGVGVGWLCWVGLCDGLCLIFIPGASTRRLRLHRPNETYFHQLR